MIISDYYQKYNGPTLTKATFDGENITQLIQNKYGSEKNWSGCLWTYKELFGEKSHGKHFRCDFVSEDGRQHWFYGFIHDINQYFNPPLATPMNQTNGSNQWIKPINHKIL